MAGNQTGQVSGKRAGQAGKGASPAKSVKASKSTKTDKTPKAEKAANPFSKKLEVDRRSLAVLLKFSPREIKALDQAVAKTDMCRAEYIRDRCLPKERST